MQKKPFIRLMLTIGLILMAGSAFSQTIGLSPLSPMNIYVNINVIYNDGNQEVFSLTDDNDITFNGENTIVINAVNGTTEIDIDDIRKIIFQQTEGIGNNKSADISIFPNPAYNSLTISGIEHNKTLTIYAMDGHAIINTDVMNNDVIDISSLAKGIYFIKIDNTIQKLLKL